MKQIMRGFVAIVLLSASMLLSAQAWRPPAAEQRCPSKWGSADERGAGNHMKPEAVLRAAKLISFWLSSPARIEA